MSSSSAHFNSALLAKCSSLLSTMRYLLCTHATELTDEPIALYWHHLFIVWRTHIFKPLCTNNQIQLRLSIKQIGEVWRKKIDRAVIKELGDSAGTDSPSPKCGSLVDAICAELELQCKKSHDKSKEIGSLLDIFDAMTSPRLTEWWRAYLPTTLQSNVVNSHKRIVDIRLDFICQLNIEFFRHWSALYRSSLDKKWSNDWSDFRTLLFDQTTLWFYAHRELTNNPNHTSQLVSKTKSSVVFSAELTVKHRLLAAKLDSYIQSQTSSSAAPHKPDWNHQEESYSSHQDARTCKVGEECFDREIKSTHQYVLCRCSNGCSLSFHTDCYKRRQSTMTEDEEGRLTCINTHRCDGYIWRARIKQQGKVIAELITLAAADEEEEPKAQVGEADHSDEEEDPFAEIDPEQDIDRGEVDSESAGASFAPPISATLLRASRCELGPDGLLVFKDIARRRERTALKEERRKREEQRLAEKKKRMEEEAIKAAEKPRADTPTKPVTKSKPYFEVVVSKPAGGEESGRTPPLAPARPLKDAFQRLNLDDDEKVENPYQRNSWDERNAQPDPEPVSLFPINVKVKGNKKGRKTAQQLEDEQLQEALAASRKEAKRAERVSAMPMPTAAQIVRGMNGSAPPASDPSAFPSLPTPSLPTPSTSANSSHSNASKLSASAASFSSKFRQEGELVNSEEPGSDEEGSVRSDDAASSQSSINSTTSSAVSTPYSRIVTPTIQPPSAMLGATALAASTPTTTAPIRPKAVALALPMPAGPTTTLASSSASAFNFTPAPVRPLPTTSQSMQQRSSAFPLSAGSSFLPASAMGLSSQFVSSQPSSLASSTHAFVSPSTSIPSPVATSHAIQSPQQPTARSIMAPPVGLVMNLTGSQSPTVTPSSSQPATPRAVISSTPPPASIPPPSSASSSASTTIQLVHSIALANEGEETPMFLLHNTPASLSASSLPSLFSEFGRCKINLLYSSANPDLGLIAVIHFVQKSAAIRAAQQVRGKMLQIEVESEGAVDMEQWRMQPVFAAFPAKVTMQPQAKIKVLQ